MGETDTSLCEQASRMVATSQTLRARRANLGRERVRVLEQQRVLREKTSVLSHDCQERREVLGCAIARWSYVARCFQL